MEPVHPRHSFSAAELLVSVFSSIYLFIYLFLYFCIPQSGGPGLLSLVVGLGLCLLAGFTVPQPSTGRAPTPACLLPASCLLSRLFPLAL